MQRVGRSLSTTRAVRSVVSKVWRVARLVVPGRVRDDRHVAQLQAGRVAGRGRRPIRRRGDQAGLAGGVKSADGAAVGIGDRRRSGRRCPARRGSAAKLTPSARPRRWRCRRRRSAGPCTRHRQRRARPPGRQRQPPAGGGAGQDGQAAGGRRRCPGSAPRTASVAVVDRPPRRSRATGRRRSRSARPVARPSPLVSTVAASKRPTPAKPVCHGEGHRHVGPPGALAGRVVQLGIDAQRVGAVGDQRRARRRSARRSSAADPGKRR